MDFTSDVYPVAEKYARRVFGADDELVAIALVLAWVYFSRRDQDYAPSSYARLAVMSARNGRDLPGVGCTHSDVWKKLTRWQGGGMNHVLDRRPGPARQAQAREEYAILMASLTDGEKKLAGAIEDGLRRTDEIAERIGCSPGRVSQMRRQVAEKAR